MRTYSVKVWVLDENQKLSAQYMTDKTLKQSLKNSFRIITCAILYWNGIRTKGVYVGKFSQDEFQTTMDTLFPNWTFKFIPSLKESRWEETKWCRKCGEHFWWMYSYCKTLCDEIIYRHPNAKWTNYIRNILNWLNNVENMISVPMANIKEIQFPWKNLNPKFRNCDIIIGYRKAFIDMFKSYDIMKEYQGTNRDIPQFVLDAFVLDY